MVVDTLHSNQGIYIICSYFKSLKFLSDSHSGAIAEHFSKIAHKIAKSNIF